MFSYNIAKTPILIDDFQLTLYSCPSNENDSKSTNDNYNIRLIYSLNNITKMSVDIHKEELTSNFDRVCASIVESMEWKLVNAKAFCVDAKYDQCMDSNTENKTLFQLLQDGMILNDFKNKLIVFFDNVLNYYHLPAHTWKLDIEDKCNEYNYSRPASP